MRKSQSLTKPTAELYPAENLTKPHSIKWWSLKLFAGSALIAALFLHYVYQLPAQFSFSTLAAQLLVIFGGGVSLLHYFCLKQSNSDILRPDSLEHNFVLFKLVRHPMYLGDCITYIGLFLLFPNTISAIILALGLLALVKQSNVEDDFVEKMFPEQFNVWKSKTKLIFPYLH